MPDLLLAAVAGLAVAALCTPVGVSGAVLLLPAQTSVMGLSGPAVSSTNLLFNVVSTPGGLTQLYRTTVVGRLELATVAVMAVPAAVAGALLRVTVLADADVFRLLVTAALLPMAATLLWRWLRPAQASRDESVSASPAAGIDPPGKLDRRLGRLAALSVLTSLVGAAVGFGGGSLLAPGLVVATSRGPHQVAPLALMGTLITSVTGLAAYTILEEVDFGARPAAPDWLVGIAMGLGGLVGSLLGARVQAHLNERVLSGLLAGLVATIAVAQLLVHT